MYLQGGPEVTTFQIIAKVTIANRRASSFIPFMYLQHNGFKWLVTFFFLRSFSSPSYYLWNFPELTNNLSNAPLHPAPHACSQIVYLSVWPWFSFFSINESLSLSSIVKSILYSSMCAAIFQSCFMKFVFTFTIKSTEKQLEVKT